MEMTVEQKRAMAMAAARKRQMEASPAPAEKPEGFFPRARQTLTTALSDSLSTLAGDTYGRNGDPTHPDNLNPARRVLKAAGGDIIPAAGEVTSDALIEAGKAVLPESAQNAIAEGAQYVAESAPVRVIGKGLDKWKEASPESYATAGEIANVASVFLPVKKIPVKDFGSGKRLANSVAKTRAEELRNLFEPAKPITGKVRAGDLVVKDNLLKTKEFVPNKKYQEMIDEVAAIPEVNPRLSATENMTAVNNEITKMRQALQAKLDGQPPITQQQLSAALANAKAEIMKSSYMVGDAKLSAKKLGAVFDDLIQQKMVNGEITPNDLMDVRIRFDQMAKADNPNILTPGGSAAKVTTQKLRQSLNDLIDAHVPNAGVRTDLDKMHRLMKGGTYLAKAAENEGGNRLSRYINTVENRTGFKHAVTPRAASGNLMDTGAAIVTGGAALAAGGGRALAEGLARNSAASQRMLATAIRNAPNIAAKAALIDAMNKEKEEANAQE